MAWIKAVTADEVRVGNCKGVYVEGENIAIYNIGGQFHATSDICTHGQALLSDGYFDGEIIECPLHQGCFNVTNGEPCSAPVTEALRVFPIRIVGADVMVEI